MILQLNFKAKLSDYYLAVMPPHMRPQGSVYVYFIASLLEFSASKIFTNLLSEGNLVSV